MKKIIPLSCVTLGVSRAAAGNEAFTRDPLHAHGCPKSPTKTFRHEAVKQALLRIARLSGCPFSTEVTVGPARRLDILFYCPDFTRYVDVSIVHPCAPSLRDKMVATLLTQRASEKFSKYTHVIAGVPVVPFVATPFGSLGSDASALLKTFAERAHSLFGGTVQGHLSLFSAIVGMAIQSGNTAMAMAAVGLWHPSSHGVVAI
jgi:hypothetical protein